LCICAEVVNIMNITLRVPILPLCSCAGEGIAAKVADQRVF
jgi:hypothetical protein